MNEIQCIRSFLRVVEVGSFAEASRQIGIAKSVVIKRVNQLEEDMELQLLHRSTRKLTLTDTGADFYQRFSAILSEYDEAKSAVRSIEWALSGVLRVSCISSFTAEYLASDLCSFQEEHPELQVELHQLDRICDPVQEGFDVSIQPSAPHSGSIQTSQILNLSRLVVATPAYLEEHGTPEVPTDLSKHRFAHNIHIQPVSTIPILDGKTVRPVPFEPVMLTNTIWMLLAAVLSNKCMAMMPVFFIEEQLASGELVPVLPNHRLQMLSLDAWYRRASYTPMKIRIFLDFLRQRYSAIPPWEKRLRKSNPELSKILGLPEQAGAS